MTFFIARRQLLEFGSDADCSNVIRGIYLECILHGVTHCSNADCSNILSCIPIEKMHPSRLLERKSKCVLEAQLRESFEGYGREPKKDISFECYGREPKKDTTLKIAISVSRFKVMDVSLNTNFNSHF